MRALDRYVLKEWLRIFLITAFGFPVLIVIIDLTEKLACPMIGVFGNDDANPNREHVNKTEAVLKQLGKNYEFHRYDGCGHAFFNWARVSYRPEQAADGWAKVFAFLKKNLG